MSLQLLKFVAPIALFLAPGPLLAQHHAGGHSGGHAGGYHGGAYHGGGGHYGGYGGSRGGYYGGYSGYRGGYGYGSPFLGGYGLGGYGLGYGGFGYGGLGYGGLGYGRLGSGGYGYSVPYSSGGYYAPVNGWYTDPVSPIDAGVIQASGTGSIAVTSEVAAPAQVTVLVPDGAQVWFDGKEAAGSGGSRVFTSPTLQPGQSSTLAVKARWAAGNGEMQLPIRAGDKMTVDLR